MLVFEAAVEVEAAVRGRGRCRGVEAAVEAAVEVWRLPSKC
jgi:hypothetical protein